MIAHLPPVLAAGSFSPLVSSRRPKQRTAQWYALGVQPLPGGIIEEMHQARIGFEPDLVARLELMALAEHRDDFFAAKLGKYLRLRAGRLDHLDLRLRALVGEYEMLGPDAVDRRPAIPSRGRRGERQAHAGWSLERRAAVGADRTFQKIHRRRADESGHKQILG